MEKKLGISSIEVNIKFKDEEEAFRYAKRLNSFIRYICKKNASKNWMAQSMIVVSNMKGDICRLKYDINGKRGRPPKIIEVSENLANKLYKGEYTTDYHLHILLVSRPSYAFENIIKEYIDKNWAKDKNKLKKKVYKKKCNIEIAKYFISQSIKILFCNCNYGVEQGLKYTLKEYYREYLKLDSSKRRLYARHRLNPMSENEYLETLEKLKISLILYINIFRDY